MQDAIEEIRELIVRKAVHRNGSRIAEVNEEFILKQAAGELVELAFSPDNPEEMADLLNNLMHYCIKKNWDMVMIEKLMIKKLDTRFTKEK